MARSSPFGTRPLSKAKPPASKAPSPAQPPTKWLSGLGEACPLAPAELGAIGKVGKPHGVQGAFKCVPLTDFPERFEETDVVHIHYGKPPVRTVEIESV